VEKNQYNLCIEVLERFRKANFLNEIILIGSWCIQFYKAYFSDIEYISALKTRDIDFLIPVPSRLKRKTDVPELLKDLGFVIDFRGNEGYIKLVHPELIIEFLVPEKGKGIDKPYPLPQLGINAQTLRFLNMLTDNVITIKVENLQINVPHPANFALHKLIISKRRAKKEKGSKDKEAAIRILRALIRKGEQNTVKNLFNSLPRKWQNKIISAIESEKEYKILENIS